MRILGLDFETTGLDTQNDRVIEIGAVLWDWEAQKPLKIMSELVKTDREISQEITDITGITAADVEEFGIPAREALDDLNDLIRGSAFVMAHNGNDFDLPLYKAWVVRSEALLPEVSWIDSKVDIVYPKRFDSRRLIHLGAEHGFVSAFQHRAVFDVLTMLRIASQYDIEAIIKRAAEPTLYVEALVSFERKDEAKERGYKWFGPRKIWWKAFKASDLVVERAECGFALRSMAGNPEK